MAAWSITFWDVGQGDATDIILPNGDHILIDAGPLSKWENPLPWWFSQQGCPTIALAVLTHSHLDHFGGFVTLAGDYRQVIRRFVLLPDAEFRKRGTERSVDMNHLLAALKTRQIAGETISKLVSQPEELYRSDGLCLKMAYPHTLADPIPYDVNKTSMVLVLERVATCEPLIVWGGDNTLHNIKSACGDASPCIMMGPHHGHPQDKASTPLYYKFFRDHMHPKCTFVSVGRTNAYKLPNANYIKGAACAGVKICCSQLAKNCDPVRQMDVYGGSGMLGLPKPKGSVQCRGAMRIYASSEYGIKFDECQASYDLEIRSILMNAPCKRSSQDCFKVRPASVGA